MLGKPKPVAEMVDYKTDDGEIFNKTMFFILENIEKPEPELVRSALMKAPAEIVEYLADDKHFNHLDDIKDATPYSIVAREILLERILLGGPDKN